MSPHGIEPCNNKMKHSDCILYKLMLGMLLVPNEWHQVK
jgi:hypothetical protein